MEKTLISKAIRWWDEDWHTVYADDPCDDITFHGLQADAKSDGWIEDAFGTSAGDTYIMSGYVRYTDGEAQYMRLCWYQPCRIELAELQPMQQ